MSIDLLLILKNVFPVILDGFQHANLNDVIRGSEERNAEHLEEEWSRLPGNHTWRLNLSRDIPEVCKGLRKRAPDGTLLRSEFVAIFTRTTTENVFAIEFIKETSRRYKQILQSSKDKGTWGRTTKRQYGWL